jgi:tRNA(Leu) C34 or U34 (ribose-2'-O)-methylase TrmL
MIKVLGIWENHWTVPSIEYRDLSFVCQEYGVDEIIMSPVTGIWPNGHLKEYQTFEESLEAIADTVPVFVDEHGTCDLRTFQHPKAATYIFGRTGSIPMKMVALEGAISVRIPTIRGTSLMWPDHCLAIVLFDRFVKEAAGV